MRPLISRVSLPPELVPKTVGVKNAPMPAPAARMRSAALPLRNQFQFQFRHGDTRTWQSG